MRNGKIRRFRPRSNKNHLRRVGHSSKNNGSHQINGHRNNFRNYVPKNPQSLERAIEKYNNLAKDALSSGDPILHESYLQHSEHYSRILSEITSSKPKENSESQIQTSENIKEDGAIANHKK